MRLRYQHRWKYILLLAVLTGACKKNDSPDPGPGTPGPSLPAAVTPVGSPAGTPVSLVIGPAGGNIASADGRAELFIPAGALSSPTNISIQPVTNYAPNGIGLAYDLLPNGTKFSKPATLTFHYTSEEVPDNIPYFLYIAYQDSARRWKADVVQRDFDTVAQTVSLDINHFTIFSFGDGIQVKANPSKLGESEVSKLTVTETTALDDEATLTEISQLDGSVLGSWFVNNIKGGDAVSGTVLDNNGQGIYTSPANIPVKKSVFVTVELKIRQRPIYKKGKKITPAFPRRGTAIQLDPFHEYDYRVSILVLDSTVSPFYGGLKSGLPIYRDTAGFDLHLKLKKQFIEYTASTPTNGPPSITPSDVTFAGIEYIWLPDVVGMINVTKVNLGQLLPEDSVIQISLQHTGAVIPGFIHKNTDGVVVYSGQPVPFGNPIGIPTIIYLDLRRGAYIDKVGAFGSYHVIAFTPVK